MKVKVFAVSAVATFAALFLSAADNTNKQVSCEGGVCKIDVKCEKVCKEKQCLSRVVHEPGCPQGGLEKPLGKSFRGRESHNAEALGENESGARSENGGGKRGS